MTEYRKHIVYLRSIYQERARRAGEIGAALKDTLGDYVTKVEAERVDLRGVSREALRDLLLKNPTLLKPLLAACNMGKRALRKDLGLEVDTLRPRLTEEEATRVAEYLLPALPTSILIDCLIALDAYQWVDSEVRKVKGRWERQFGTALRSKGVDCGKRKFTVGGQEFELDIACPPRGPIRLAVDVKMIGHPSDKHKRGDEIVNKAMKFKKTYPEGVFVALVYYPFDSDREQLEQRLRTGTEHVADVVFAGDDEESVQQAVERLYGHWLTAGVGGEPRE